MAFEVRLVAIHIGVRVQHILAAGVLADRQIKRVLELVHPDPRRPVGDVRLVLRVPAEAAADAVETEAAARAAQHGESAEVALQPDAGGDQAVELALLDAVLLEVRDDVVHGGAGGLGRGLVENHEVQLTVELRPAVAEVERAAQLKAVLGLRHGQVVHVLLAAGIPAVDHGQDLEVLDSDGVVGQGRGGQTEQQENCNVSSHGFALQVGFTVTRSPGRRP